MAISRAAAIKAGLWAAELFWVLGQHDEAVDCWAQVGRHYRFILGD